MGSITIYQAFISPYKGFHCAYGKVHTDEASCSEYGKKVILEKGLIVGLNMLQNRLLDCKKAYKIWQLQHPFTPQAKGCSPKGCGRAGGECGAAGCDSLFGDE